MAVSAFYKTGTIAVTNGSATVTGTGTMWSNAIKAGDRLVVASTGEIFEIATIVSDTELTLVVTYPGTTGTGLAYHIDRSFAGQYATETSLAVQTALTNGTLQAYADANPGADEIVYGTGAGAAAKTALTAQGRALLDDTSFDAMRATVGALSGVQVEKSGAYTIVVTDQGKTIIHTAGTATTFAFEAAATLGSTFFALVKNEGAGVLTLDPDGAETIDGSVTITLDQGQAALVFCNGTLLRTLFISTDTVGALINTNNLSDVDDAATALANLGGLAKTANLSDVDDAATALANLGGKTPPGVNLLINGDFQINQRVFGGGALTAWYYGHDRWRATGSGADYSVSGYTVTLVSGEIEQTVETAIWGVSSLASTSVTISVDTPSIDLTVTFGSQAGTITAGSGRKSVTLTLGAGDTGNLSCKIKSVSGASVTFGRVKLESGTNATDWVSRPHAVEMSLACRYYAKSYDDNTAPGTATSAGAYNFYNNASTSSVGFAPFPVTMRATPTWNAYNPVTGFINGMRSNGVNYAVTGGIVGVKGLASIYGSGWPTPNAALFQWVAEAEL